MPSDPHRAPGVQLTGGAGFTRGGWHGSCCILRWRARRGTVRAVIGRSWKTLRNRVNNTNAIRVGAAARGGSRRTACTLLAAVAAIGCASEKPPGPASSFAGTTGLSVYHASPPSHDERYCAWYGAKGPD